MVPDGGRQAREAGWTFFEVELPALGRWGFDAEQAATVSQPILFVRGVESGAPYEGVGALLESRFRGVESLAMPGMDHLMQMRDSRRVAEAISKFLARHPF